MVSTSKILTVSYGTFSCTLEGFDDSFDTMKAIAEYFRDLAADDRYFGAEPPTPDAEMLARIAEREIARRVEAHDENGRIVLRTGAAAALPSGEAAVAAGSDVSPARDTAEPAADAVAPGTEPDTGDMSEHADAVAQADTGAESDAGAAEDDTAAEAGDAPREAHDTRAGPEDAPEAPREQAEDVAPSAPAESIADKLRRIRAVSAPAAAAAYDTYSEDEHATDFLDAAVADLGAALDADDAAMDPEDMTGTRQPADPSFGEDMVFEEDDQPEEADAPEAISDTDVPQALEEAPQPADEAQPDDTAEAGSVADDMHDAEDLPQGAQGADEAQPESAQEIETAVADPGADDMHDAGDLPQGTDEAQPEEAQDAEAGADADDASEAAEVDDQEVLDALLHSAETAGDDSDSGEDADDYDIAIEPEDTLAQLMADAMPDAEATPPPLPAESGRTEEPSADTAPESARQEETDDAATTARPAAARVIKVRRRELDSAIAQGRLVEESDDNAETSEAAQDDVPEGRDKAPAAPATSLSPEDEAELQRELAAVEAEIKSGPSDAAQDDAETTDDPLPDAAEAASPAAKPTAPTAGFEDDDDVEAVRQAAEAQDAAKRGKLLEPIAADDQAPRMFDEADTQFEEPEGNQRRNAIQHLRAAVAATKAERQAGGAMQPDVDDKPYRHDLESAVRPRRPQVATGSDRPARPQRPDRNRPAPLKLVAEQRIDTPTNQPVRPRRISRADLAAAPRRSEAKEAAAPAPEADRTAESRQAPAAPATEGGFTAFAEKMGAHDLPDLLEAAAAYMADVEGQPEFSRPMLMHKLKEAVQADFSREEGLRSFGKLLRDGKLQKLKGGRFSVTDTTDFRPKARAAG